MKRQDFDGLQLKKSKALKAELKAKARESRADTFPASLADVKEEDDAAELEDAAAPSRKVGTKSKR
jgi:hypothetical protein